MKHKVYQELIRIINSVMGGTPLDAEGFDWDAIDDLAIRHRLCGMVYEAAKFRTDIPEDALLHIRNHFFTAAGQQKRQEHYAEELDRVFREKEIPYAALRGARMRKLYPRPTYRLSGDLNFFVHPEHREDVADILLGYGFRRSVTEEQGDHYILDHVEIHIHTFLRVRLQGMEDYYANVWDRLVTEDGILYDMTPEDFYIYEMALLQRNFISNGVGIRSVVDIAVLRHAFPNLDRAYVDGEFKKIGISRFASSMEALTDAWFADAPSDDDLLLLGKYIAGFGTPEYAELMYASENMDLSAREQRKHRTRKVILPRRVMRMKYPCLRKYPALMPLFWFARIFTVPFGPKNAELQEIESATVRRRVEDLALRLRAIAGLDEKPGEYLEES